MRFLFPNGNVVYVEHHFGSEPPSNDSLLDRAISKTAPSRVLIILLTTMAGERLIFYNG